jgi:two-component system response regulator PilR (NtrC family)
LDDILEGLEKQYIICALERTDGNRTDAAKLLGVSFRSIRYKLAKYGILDHGIG